MAFRRRLQRMQVYRQDYQFAKRAAGHCGLFNSLDRSQGMPNHFHIPESGLLNSDLVTDTAKFVVGIRHCGSTTSVLNKYIAEIDEITMAVDGADR
jgi:hypothetical protein